MIIEGIKSLLGDDLSAQVEAALKGKGKAGKDVDLVIGNDGSFVPADKYNGANSGKTSAENALKAAAEALKAIGGIERSQLGSEIHENEIVNALVGNALNAVVEGANPLLPGIVQHILRVVAKRDHSSSQAALASLALERLNKRAVSEVKTVEHANSGCNCHRWALLWMVDYLHLYLLK